MVTAQTNLAAITEPLSVLVSEPSGTTMGSVRAGQSRPLRILHVVNRLDTGGTEHVVLNLIRGLDADRFESRICVTRGFNPELVRTEKLAAPYEAGQASSGSQFLVPGLSRIMKEYRPDVVHSRNWGAIEAVVAARISGVPVAIHSEHGYEVDMIAGLPIRRRIIRRTVYPMADAIFTVSSELRDYHARQAWFDAARIRVVHNGVETRKFQPDARMREEARRKLGISADEFVVGSVGRMVAIKDHPTLLQAAAELARRGVNVRVLLAGAGPELENHRAMVTATPELAQRVNFLGPTGNVAEVLNAIDVFVLPSLLEGMSNTILEAMACGIPVVATRVGGNPELVQDGATGWLFTPREVAALTERLADFAARPEMRNAFGAAARERVVSEFSLQGMIANYQNLYLEMAERRQIAGIARN